MNKYTIVITSHNMEPYITPSLKSVMNQSYPFFECIIVDDGSTDNTINVINDVIKGDERFKLITQDSHGVSNARNAAFKYITGDYVLFLDGDDTLTLDCLKTVDQNINDNDLLIFGISFVYYENSIETKRTNSAPKPLTFSSGHDLASWYVINHAIMLYSCSNKMYRVSLLKEHNLYFDDDCLWGEDRIFNYRYLDVCDKARSIDICMLEYNQINDNSLTHKFRPRHIVTLLYLHKAKMDIILNIADNCNDEEKDTFRKYDIRKEVYNAFSFLASFKDKLDKDTFNSELEYLNSINLPSYFYDSAYNNESLIDWINNNVYTTSNIPLYKPDVVIVLGSNSCEYRISYAYEVFNKYDDITYISTGGNPSRYTDDNNKPLIEAEYMAKYLTDKGINPSHILIDDKAHNTYENLYNAYNNFNLKDKKAVVVTAGFHHKRTKELIDKLGYKMDVISIDGPNTRKDNWFLTNGGIDAIFSELIKEMNQ